MNEKVNIQEFNQPERLGTVNVDGGPKRDVEAEFKDKWPKLWDILKTETLSIECDLGDRAKINGGFPTVCAQMVKRDNDPAKVIASARPIVMLKFGDADSEKGRPDALTFYKPDGSIFKQLSDDEGKDLDSAVTNSELSELWGMEADAPFMQKVGEVLVKTALLLNAAADMSKATGVPFGKAFDMLSRMTFDQSIATVGTIRPDGSLTDSEGNPLTFRNAETEGAE